MGFKKENPGSSQQREFAANHKSSGRRDTEKRFFRDAEFFDRIRVLPDTIDEQMVRDIIGLSGRGPM